MRNKIVIAFTLLFTVFGLFGLVHAQEKRLRSRYLQGVDLKSAVEAAREGRAQPNKKILSEINSAYSEDKENLLIAQSQLTGTWYMTVPGATPEETFYALQTFGTDGTFVETSSLLGQLFEGPAHGVYECRARSCTLTFEVFEFGMNGEHIGKVRVRNLVRLINPNHLVSDYAVDFIELDGTEFTGIGTGSFSGDRMQVRGL
jgi:hypothetical protein